MHKFTDEEIKMLAQLERDMDSGKQPFVICGGHRTAIMPEMLHKFGLVSGQSVSDFLMMQILEAQLSTVTQKRDEKFFDDNQTTA